ncbi:MAG TPA: TPM domain-containing protein [Victivallales bacterium]|nr:TPM domain-containing protein [Victivallales bacterium]
MKFQLINKFKILAILTALFIMTVGILNALPIPALTGRVVDNASMLTFREKNDITNALKNFEKNTRGQMTVLIIPSLKGEPIENFSIKTAEKWKIGYKDKDDGLILIIVKDDRKFRLEVGYGWEGKINDARAGDIIRSMVPFFRKHEFGNGILLAVAEAQGYITGNITKQSTSISDNSNNSDDDSGWFIYIFLAIFFLASFFFPKGRGRTYGSGGSGFWGGGSSGGSSGGGFSGGGGGFGGGGASGGW